MIKKVAVCLLLISFFIVDCCGNLTPTTIILTPTVTPTTYSFAGATATVVITKSITSTVVVSHTISSSLINTYTVKTGDTLFGIAYHFGITVESLKYANGLKDDTIYLEQILQIPTDYSISTSPISITTIWHPSILEGDLQQFYSKSIATDRFIVHFVPGTYPDTNSQIVVDMITKGLQHIESTLNANLDGSFDVYVAGGIFAHPNESLRGYSFSAARRYLFLHDGTGNPADQQYIATHELTHLFTWNVFGRPVSAMLSEGASVYTGMSLISNSQHIPLDVFCAAYHQKGKLPRISISLNFNGHIRDLENYYTAGCFVKYLISTYGPDKFGQLYPTGNYAIIYGKSLIELEQDWISYLDTQISLISFNPDDLITMVESVSNAYGLLFSNFQGTSNQMLAYEILDKARIALMEGRFEEARLELSKFDIILKNSQ